MTIILGCMAIIGQKLNAIHHVEVKLREASVERRALRERQDAMISIIDRMNRERATKKPASE